MSAPTNLQSTATRRVYIATENDGYGAALSGSVAVYELDHGLHDVPLPAVATEILEFDPARRGFQKMGQVKGAEGGDIPGELKFLPANAYEENQLDGAVENSSGVLQSAAMPNGWLRTVLGATLGADVVGDATAGFTPWGPTEALAAAPDDLTHARVCGGGEIDTVNTSGGVIVSVEVDRTPYAGSEERFCPGCVIVLVNSAGEKYPVLVTDVTVSGGNDVLTIFGGPAAGSVLAGDDIWGTYTVGAPFQSDNASMLLAMTTGVGATRRRYWVFRGVQGNLMFEVPAKGVIYMKMTGQYNAHEYGLLDDNGTLGTALDNATEWVDYPPRIATAIDRRVRLAEAGAALDTTISAESVEIDMGVQRAEAPDVNGVQGRRGNPITMRQSTVNLSSYFDMDRLEELDDQTGLTFSMLAGSAQSATWGQFGAFVPWCKLAEVPNMEDKSGIQGASISLRAMEPSYRDSPLTGDANKALSDIYLFWL